MGGCWPAAVTTTQCADSGTELADDLQGYDVL